MLRSLILISVIALISGCASNPSSMSTRVPQQVASADSVQTLAVEDVAAPDEMPIPRQVVLSSESKMVCTREPVTGSRIGVKKCRTKKQIEMERVQTQQFLQKTKNSPQHSHIRDG
jgi:hypothetical protein